MKTILFISLLMAFIPASAQYQSIFGRETTQWTGGAWRQTSSGSLGFFTIGILLEAQQDTLAFAKTYKVISQKYSSTSEGDNFLIREDTTVGRIWYREYLENLCSPSLKPDSTERLICDMSLQVGDTFDVGGTNTSRSSSTQNYYATVDSVYIGLQGEKHIRFNTNQIPSLSSSLPIEFIEGVGPNTTLLASHYCWDIRATNLICHKKMASGLILIVVNMDVTPTSFYQ